MEVWRFFGCRRHGPGRGVIFATFLVEHYCSFGDKGNLSETWEQLPRSIRASAVKQQSGCIGYSWSWKLKKKSFCFCSGKGLLFENEEHVKIATGEQTQGFRRQQQNAVHLFYLFFPGVCGKNRMKLAKRQCNRRE